jgi:hypothetical protein
MGWFMLIMESEDDFEVEYSTEELVHCICMDFITNLPEPQRYNALLVMVVRFAKLAYMVPIVKPQPRWRAHSQFSKVGGGTTGCQE